MKRLICLACVLLAGCAKLPDPQLLARIDALEKRLKAAESRADTADLMITLAITKANVADKSVDFMLANQKEAAKCMKDTAKVGDFDQKRAWDLFGTVSDLSAQQAKDLVAHRKKFHDKVESIMKELEASGGKRPFDD